MPPAVDHVVVLALENRSFDHMLGFVPHADPAFDGLLSGGPYTNPPWRGGGPPIPATPDAKSVLPVDPNHSHDAVLQQLQIQGQGADRRATNQGFVASFEEHGRGLAPPTFEGLLAPLANWWSRRRAAANPIEGRGGLIMRCQPPGQVPVLAALALGFGVCAKWFCSVPGETWPNRNFMHAATSDGTVDNEVRFYTDPTIFELLEDHGRTWRIYYDDTPQVWAFQHLWEPDRLPNWFPFPDFARHVQQDQLPSYSFIEPNHRPPVHVPTTPGSGAEHSDNQHPGNNLAPNAAYDGYAGDGGDFQRGEQLIAAVYEALRPNPTVFERTLLLVTYDEHGGCYDHVPPPTGVPSPGEPVTRGWRDGRPTAAGPRQHPGHPAGAVRPPGGATDQAGRAGRPVPLPGPARAATPRQRPARPVQPPAPGPGHQIDDAGRRSSPARAGAAGARLLPGLRRAGRDGRQATTRRGPTRPQPPSQGPPGHRRVHPAGRQGQNRTGVAIRHANPGKYQTRVFEVP